jgi:phosphate transport system permease protein
MNPVVQTPPPVRGTPVPARFQVSRPTVLLDRFMNYFIKIGGVGIIVAVCGIFVFILSQILPLFSGAKVRELASFSLGDREVASMGMDEWGELPFFVEPNGHIHFLDIMDSGTPHNRGWFTPSTGLPDDLNVSAITYNARSSEVLLGTDDGRFSAVKVNYRATFPERGGREVTVELSALPLLPIGREGFPLVQLAYGDSGTRKIAGAIQRIDGRAELHAIKLDQPRTLFGAGEIRVVNAFDLSEHLQGDPMALLIPWEADAILVANRAGEVTYLFYEGDTFAVRQRFQPFADLPDPAVASMHFVLGDVSIVFTSPTGAMRVWSLYRDPESNLRLYGHTKSFPDLKHGASFYSESLRNKAFLTGTGNFATLRYVTTENVRWESELPFDVKLALIGPRYDLIYFLDTKNLLHRFDLNDPHPVAGWKTYFGKIQYEGQPAPSYEWQSTGGRDDFEKKLSLVPLIIGTLKGTFYALVFAVPIALFAAIYTSQFLKPEIKRYVKPTMEIMASLPSVVLGFLAALWLAPIFSNSVPSVILAILSVFAGTVAMGWIWQQLPQRLRSRTMPGLEFTLLLPVVLLCAWIGWSLGPVAERAICIVTDPASGRQVADFRLWFPTVTGLGFEQRNAFVVGFVMGFAVIPIIFTIAEDSMSNVPDAFRSGSLALGASRWQTAIRIVLPTASAGIFSALMIGLGRAVGETMIVVMATGNVPVTEFNLFTGMRTLSANIAVELPEAPYQGTLYRTLFLGAMALFLMTFMVNTVAEILRQHLREKYKAVE